MKNVICDICGTTYPADLEICPICGSAREYAMEGEETVSAGIEAEEPGLAAGFAEREEIALDDDDQVRGRHHEDDDFDDDEPVREESDANIGLVIILVILIVLLLLTVGFFFVRYLLPDMAQEGQTAVATTVPVQTEAVIATTDPRIPCTNLMMDGGKMEMGRDGKRLLNVRAFPADTTDVLTYTSRDESVVTVSADGTITAVGEGQTIIDVVCGSQTIHCGVTVDYSIGLEPVPTEVLPFAPMELPAETEAQEEIPTAPEETVEETAAPVETTAATEAAEPSELKMVDPEIAIYNNHESVVLELEGNIPPEQIKWFTMDSRIAIVRDGVVTSTGPGSVRVYGEYNGKQISCLVHCRFN